jgi:oligopeptide/dipeptide ABC transporter ATP-binding protein
MYAGKLVEEGPVRELFDAPLHPYTAGLLKAIPGRSGPEGPVRRLPTLPGQVPDPSNPPPGCRFHPRCEKRFEPCDRSEPAEARIGPRRVACFLHEPGGAS